MFIPLYAAACLLSQAPSIRVSSLFTDGMVLQRNQSIPFFGTARPGTKISVTLNNHHVFGRADADGTWKLNFHPMAAGGPYTASVVGDGTITIRNVMVGEVWFCSGQSNMEMRVDQANDIEAARAQADSEIRMFTVAHQSTETPVRDLGGSWVSATADSVANFSAVAYWFAVNVHKKLGVPVGLIHSSWGGTPGEAWTSRDALRQSPNLIPIVENYEKGLSGFADRKAKYDRDYQDWKASVYHSDLGNDGFGLGYADPMTDVSAWRAVTLPNLLEVTEGKDMDGAVWYRREVELPPNWDRKDLVLELGKISDFDTTYFNGVRIGEIDSHYPYAYAMSRVYPVPPALVHAGRNVIAVRVFNQYGRGGFTDGASKLRLLIKDHSQEPISLAGDWVSRIERFIEPASPELVQNQPQPPLGPGHPWAPGGLFYGMVAPVIPYGIRGVLWYQGESNTDRAYQYRDILTTLITDWRKKWNSPELPFLFVQLANYTQRAASPADSSWAELREAQALALQLPKTGMVTAIDIGEANDIHPKNKPEVGRRLSLVALNQVYGENIQSSGPVYKSFNVEDDSVHIQFTNATKLKTSDGAEVAGFTIAGEDRKFYWANARIVRNEVIVSCIYVPKPVSVRYGWANNPYVNLVNEEGLPAFPFRTDDWPGITIANSVKER